MSQGDEITSDNNQQLNQPLNNNSLQNSTADEQKPKYTEEELKQHQAVFWPQALKTVYLSVCFMLLFSAFNSAQNMVSTVYHNLGYGDLGNIALFSLYFTFGISSFFGSQLVSFASPKLIFIISGIGYNLFMLAGYVVVHCPDSNEDLPFQCKQGVLYTYIIIASMITGVSAATIWVSQGGYIEAVSSICPSKSSVFVGIFWSLMQCSQILGNTLSYFLLGMNNGTVVYFTIMLIIGAVGNIMFIFLPSALKSNQQNQEEDKKKPMPKISRMVKLIKMKEIRPLSALMGFTGLIIGFYSGFLHRLVDNTLTPEELADDNIANQKTAQIFIVLGISEVFSGLVSGELGRRFDLYTMATIGTLLAELGLVLSLLGYFLNSYNVIFGIAGVWGFTDCFFNVIVQEICQKDYPDYIEIFALFRLVLAFSNSFTQVLSITITNDWVFLVVVVCFQMLTNICTKLLSKPDMSQLIDKDENSEQNDDDNNSQSYNDLAQPSNNLND